ncbi:MAG: hypothetical protein KC912_07505 [Proteobacteria bacterium]|nr:hypothetical protein [Pseudomonadota bacterium]
MSQDLRIAVAGATGALGKEVLTVLASTSWAPETVTPLASERTTVSFIEYNDRQIAVDDLGFEALEDMDVVFLAVPEHVALEAGERAAEGGAFVVDCSGAFSDDPMVPMVVPWVNPERLAEPAPKGIFSMPLPEVTLMGPILSALGRAGILGEVDATIMVPASARGRGGVDELSKQVIALFSANSPPRKVFPDGLAFDLIPAIGMVGDNGWTDREALISRQVSQILGIEIPVRVTLVGVPVFSGMSVNLSIRTPRATPPDLVERVLTDAGLVKPEMAGIRYLPRPRRVDGQPFVNVGRIREFPTGGGLQIFAAFDNLRGTATAAVAIAGAMLKTR